MSQSTDRFIRDFLEEINKLSYVKPEEIPNIDLYMDQVTTFMDEHLKSSKRFSEDKILTKTMINNYTKNNLLPPPMKKKYSKEHMLLLIFIYYFKNFLSINDIQVIFTPLAERFFRGEAEIGLEDVYKQVYAIEKESIDSMMKDVIRKFKHSKETFSNVNDEKDQEFLSLFSFICMLSFDVYVKKTIIEKLIDTTLKGTNEEKKKPPKDT